MVSVPFFSVIITTYNRSVLLIRAIDSLISQTELNWEAIVIDDGSVDDTEYQILLFMKKCKRIHYLKTVHGGEVVAKNIGIHRAKGNFITFLDSDDEYRWDHLQSRKHLIMQNPKIDFLYGGVSVIGNTFVPDRFDYLKSINLSNCAIGGTFFVRRELLLSVKGFNQMDYGADADLFDRLICDNLNILKTMLPTYIYHRDTAKSIVNNLKTQD